MYPKALTRLLVLTGLMLLAPGIFAKGIYMTADEFLQNTFPKTQPEPQVIWLNAELKAEISKFLYRPYRGLRVRYWQHQNRSAWIFDEIGKERPITIGVVVNNQQLEAVKILAFRESRGGEVRHSFFTDQFQGVTLTEKNKLSQIIDGITGATMSVNAVKRASQLALFLEREALNQQALKEQSTESSED